MKKSNKSADVPVLEDVVVPGKPVPTINQSPKETPLKKSSTTAPVSSALNEVQLAELQKQIELIIQAKVKKAAQEALKDIRAYLEKTLPTIIK